MSDNESRCPRPGAGRTESGGARRGQAASALLRSLLRRGCTGTSRCSRRARRGPRRHRGRSVRLRVPPRLARPPESGTLGLCLCDLSRPGGTMKIAVVGATGWIGGTVVREALARDHDVTAVVRDPSRLELEHDRLSVAPGGRGGPAGLADALAGHDAVVVSVSGRKEGKHSLVPAAAGTVLAALPQAGVKRLVWV